MTIFQLITREKSRLLQEKASIECQIHDAPSGTLTFVKNKSKDKIYYKWYVRNEKSGSRRSKKYLRRQEKKFAKTLAKKGLLKARLDDINRELKALDAYLSKHCDSSFFQKLVSSPGYGELYAGDEIPLNPDIKEELEKWAHDEFETNPYHPEERNVPTDYGIFVRSKSEAIILMLLVMYNIPRIIVCSQSLPVLGKRLCCYGCCGSVYIFLPPDGLRKGLTTASCYFVDQSDTA